MSRHFKMLLNCGRRFLGNDRHGGVVLFLRRMEQRLNPVEAQLLFLHLDSDRDGLLTMLELLQIVFSKLERRDQVALHKVCWDAHLHLAARRKQKDMELLIQKRTERLLGRGGDDSSVGSRSWGRSRCRR